MIEIDRYNWNLARSFFCIIICAAIIGIVCNLLLLLTTVQTRSLRSTCNILIAICAVGDLLHQGLTPLWYMYMIQHMVAGGVCTYGSFLAQLPMLFDVYIEIDSRICDLIMFLPGMGIALGNGCIFCIGLDRMISVIFSIRYRRLNKLYYHAFLGLLLVGCCAFVSYLMIAFFEEERVLCEVLSPYPNGGVVVFSKSVIIINCLSSIVYFITWLGLRTQAGSTIMKRIVKSLFIIVTVDVSGWFITPGLFALYEKLDLNTQQMFAWGFFNKIFVNIAFAIKLFIYYSTSSDYRSAVNEFIFKKKQSKSRTSAIKITTSAATDTP